MSEQEFLEKLVEIMDTEEELGMDSVLTDIEEWDSLSYVSFLAICSRVAKTRVDPQEVRDALTVRHLYQLMNR